MNEKEINQFHLSILLNDKQKKDYIFLLQKGVYCNTCKSICTEGVEVKHIFLNSMNDIMIKGNCKKCGGKVVRIMEFGEDKSFFEKASDFRKRIR